MIKSRNYSRFAVFAEDAILTALNKISANRARTIVAVSESGHVEGVLTDGDLRRWLTATDRIDLDAPVRSIVNEKFVSALVDDAPATIRAKFTPGVTVVPLLDGQGRLVAVATADLSTIEIAGAAIGEGRPTYFIAEIGNNHNGDLAQATRLIDEAAAAGADCAKFQMRDLATLYDGPGRQDVSGDLGAQYTLDLLRRFQLADDDLLRAFDHCAARRITPLCTPWDAVSLYKLERYGMAAYKIASADFTHHDFIGVVAATGKPLICSTGMATEAEVIDGVRALDALAAQYVLLHCNSTYPAPFKDVNLAYMARLKALSGGIVGYSGHERDINVALAAVSLGARVIEKHFTLDRGMEGNDHKVSLLPAEFARMIEGARQIEEALGAGGARELSQGEKMNRETLAKSLVAAVDIPAGVAITEAMIKIASPGQGLQPYRRPDLVGRALTAPKKAGDNFFESDLTGGGAAARVFDFPLPWGMPVRYHDIAALMAMSNPTLVEIHLSYKDMDLDFTRFIPAPLDLGLVVHAPELFAGDHTLDLCARDETYRRRSIAELQRVIDLTRSLKTRFSTLRPCIVTNVGGFSHQGHLPTAALTDLLALLDDSLAALDADGVEIIPQTMPPFPWHFGGQQFHNLFVEADQITAFCERTGMRVCLDTSHSKLACTHAGVSFDRFLARVLPHTAHLHLADARGVDGEGLQIGEGEIDWSEAWSTMLASPARPSFIPEIWQGHKNGGEGAWLALSRLSAALRTTRAA